MKALTSRPPARVPRATMLLWVALAVTGSFSCRLGGSLARFGDADGVLADGITVFDDHRPAVSNLDSRLLDAVRHAAADARARGVEILINSGWRSARYQRQLLDDAIWSYGSAREASRWVATADTSSHVSGHAIDVGPARARAWLSRNGAAYGLCRVYRNEPWHYELRPEAADGGCPPMYANPTRDPRMRR